MAIQQNTGFRMMDGDIGDSSFSMSEDPSRTAFDQVTSGITNLYQNMLQRSPDAGGLQYWVDQVNSGKATLADVSNAFKGSNEFLGTQLRSLNSLWDAEVANQEQPGIQSDIKTGSVDFGGRNWTAFRSPDGGVQISTLNADQSGIGSGQYRADFLDPDTGEVTTRVLDRNKTTERLGKVLIGTMAALIAAPQLAGSLFGTEAAAGLGADLAAGGLSAESLATLNAIGPSAVSEIIATTGGLLDAGLAAGAAASALPALTTPATSTIAGTLAPETLAALEAVGQTAIPEIVGTTGGLLDAGLAAGAATAAGAGTTPSVTVQSTPLPNPQIPITGIPPEVIAGGLGAGTLATLDGTGQSALQDIINNTNPNVAASTTTGGLPTSLVNTATQVAKGLFSGDQSNTIGQLINAGVNYQQAKAAADDLLKSGQISQQQYNALASNIQGQYNNLATQTGQQLGEFTPYGITTNLFGPSGQNIQNAAMQAAQQSFNQAGLTNVDQLAQDYYNKLSALSAPEQQRQRLATEERLRAQGRLGVSGSAYGGSSPELLAQEQAIAQQQLQRELQSRQAALGERGTLLSQGTAALQPAVQLGTTAQQTAQQQFASNLARQNLLTNLQTQGIQSAGVLQRQGLQDLLARQLQATAARSGANQQLTQGLLGGGGGSNVLGGVVGSALGNLFNPNAAGNINSLGFGSGAGYGNQDIGLFI